MGRRKEPEIVTTVAIQGDEKVEIQVTRDQVPAYEAIVAEFDAAQGESE